MADIFISYKSERRRAAEHLTRILELHGYTVWFDYALLSGREFDRQIERELRAARAVIVLWCGMSRDSDWVRSEAHLAKKLEKLLPVWIEKVDLPMAFDQLHTIDLSSWDGAPRSRMLDSLFIQLAQLIGRDPQEQRRGLVEYEETWRRFGAPTLASFALEPEVAKRVTALGRPAGHAGDSPDDPELADRLVISKIGQPSNEQQRVFWLVLLISREELRTSLPFECSFDGIGVKDLSWEAENERAPAVGDAVYVFQRENCRWKMSGWGRIEGASVEKASPDDDCLSGTLGIVCEEVLTPSVDVTDAISPILNPRFLLSAESYEDDDQFSETTIEQISDRLAVTLNGLIRARGLPVPGAVSLTAP